MELTPEWLGAGVVGALVAIGAAHRYLSGLKSRPPATAPQSVLAGVGFGMIDRDHAERVVRALERIADSCDRMSDKRQDDMQHSLDGILKELRKEK